MVSVGGAFAQELIPAAYVPAPVGINLVSLAVANNRGEISFDPSGPIDDASGEILISTLSYGRTLGLFGRAASVTVVMPYVVGNLEGRYLGEPADARRSGTADAVARLGINLYGAPAMSPEEFATNRMKTLLGASVTISAPTGQYDPNRLINIGTNRWSVKTQLAVVRAVGKWSFDGYAGVTLFSTNTDFAGGVDREQDPIYSSQFHVRYLFRSDLWGAADANFWYGGRTTVDGVQSDDLQANSRVGLTLLWRVAPKHSLRFAVSRGALTRVGGDFVSFGVSYGYNWRTAR